MWMWQAIGQGILGQRGALMPWSPVMLALGVGGYFALRQEPPVWALIALAGCAVAAFLAAWKAGPLLGPGLLAAGLVAAGVALAGARAQAVAAPVLDFRYYGPIEGRVVGMDRSASGALRLTLDRVRLHRVREVPARVRISLHGPPGAVPRPGLRMMTTGHLSPPQGPVEPGGFDFRRHAWFLGIGAVGYARVPLVVSAQSDGGQPVFALRMRLSRAVQAALPGEVGAFAAAITTGDRSGMGEATKQALRDTNLAHLLAISGLHMGLLASFVFGAVRLALAAVPVVALRVPGRKIAALAALVAAAGYLALSGGNVATERAFVMVAVALTAVLFDRRAISLRAVAVAAMIVLILRPEALLGPGFQMSFAATTALVAVFSRLRGAPQMMPRWLWPVVAVMLSSAVAGLATAPVAAAHFNRIAQWGLLANLTTVPLMGLVVMPAAVVAACLAPFGLEAPALWVLGRGLAWVLTVAHEIAGWDGALRHVVAPGALVLPLMALGGLFAMLWRGRVAMLGAGPVLAALALWSTAERPAILIAESGGLVGLTGESGRALSRARGSGFVARVWLENDGDGADQAGAALRWPEVDGGLASAPMPGGGTLWHVAGQRGRASFPGCRSSDLAVFNTPGLHPGACLAFTPETLRQSGALAVTFSEGAPQVRTVADQSGRRLWTP
ncbi:ComEC/Rec2 family competence protein [Marinovum algicola]|uniref:ComEC/Rec2 family competence protein n=2 Tax=Marinovum algicola TaxID=42444 RepID=UPI0024BB6CBD|nr:ComEC/Rec2 family competence protein [Marinovum algicola]